MDYMEKSEDEEVDMQEQQLNNGPFLLTEPPWDELLKRQSERFPNAIAVIKDRLASEKIKFEELQQIRRDEIALWEKDPQAWKDAKRAELNSRTVLFEKCWRR